MATFTYTIDNSIIPEVKLGVSLYFDYQDLIESPPGSGIFIPNPESKADFTERKIKGEIKRLIKRAVVIYRNSLVQGTAEIVETDYAGLIT
jgi:hypothetical protein